jgi:type IX secretion system PorP/SprF family membrane protein
MKKHLIISALILFLAYQGYGQQQAMFTQYMFNSAAINPAVVGTHGAMSITALAREQWVGLKGAPNTQTLAVHSPLLNERVGLGLTFLRDEIGITRQHAVFGAYSYKIPMGNKTLSFGLTGGFTSFKSNPSELNPNDPDASLSDDYASGFKPNFGTGVYLYSDRFYVGASAPMLVNYDITWDNPDSDESQQRLHYFLMAGYVFDLNRNLKLKPNVLVKAVTGAPVEVDLNANLLIQEILWLGVSYRSFDSIDGLIELQINPQLKIGYSHDFTVSELREVNRGSHEVVINYRMQFDKKRVITPRYF